MIYLSKLFRLSISSGFCCPARRFYPGSTLSTTHGSGRNHLPRIAFIALFVIFIIFIFTIKSYPSSCRIILLSAGKGLLISRDCGNRWENFNNGLPSSFIPVKVKIDSKENLYLITLSSGIFKFESSNNIWRNINIDDFLVRSNSNSPPEYRKISAISIDEKNPETITLATKHTIFITRNGGKSWNTASMKRLDKKNYITALAIRGKGPIIYAGTSYNGLFRKRGSHFVKTSSRLPRELSIPNPRTGRPAKGICPKARPP